MGQSDVIVYTKDNCIQCSMTKKYLTKNNVEFTEIDVEKNKEAFDYLIESGYKSVPVVVWGSTSWAGFQPEKLAKIIK